MRLIHQISFLGGIMRLLLLTILCTLSVHTIFPQQAKALSCVELEEPIINQFDMAVVGTVLNEKNDIVQNNNKIFLHKLSGLHIVYKSLKVINPVKQTTIKR